MIIKTWKSIKAYSIGSNQGFTVVATGSRIPNDSAVALVENPLVRMVINLVKKYSIAIVGKQIVMVRMMMGTFLSNQVVVANFYLILVSPQ